MKKCKKCGAPLEGFFYNTIGKLLGLKPSESDPELCNKCAEQSGNVPNAEETVEAPVSSEQTGPTAPVGQEEAQPEEPVVEQPSGQPSVPDTSMEEGSSAEPTP